ncbi:MAG: ATP-dependent Clp protease adaptor ClpS [Thermodesulfobacteriota bacterium]
MGQDKPFTEGEAGTEDKIAVQEPPSYRVLLHNDDYTTMDFVVFVLTAVFKKSQEDATTIMWSVHLKGCGECGIYPREIAETKVGQVHYLATREGFPLRCSMEPA